MYSLVLLLLFGHFKIPNSLLGVGGPTLEGEGVQCWKGLELEGREAQHWWVGGPNVRGRGGPTLEVKGAQHWRLVGSNVGRSHHWRVGGPNVGGWRDPMLECRLAQCWREGGVQPTL